MGARCRIGPPIHRGDTVRGLSAVKGARPLISRKGCRRNSRLWAVVGLLTTSAQVDWAALHLTSGRKYAASERYPAALAQPTGRRLPRRDTCADMGSVCTVSCGYGDGATDRIIWIATHKGSAPNKRIALGWKLRQR